MRRQPKRLKSDALCMAPFWQLPYDHISGHGCPSCFPGKHSQAQKEIEAYVRSLGVEVSANDRTVIPPKEIDIFMPTYRLGIEFNGTWYHSASINSASKLRRKHRGKYFLCRDKGIVLLQIDEHEWRGPAKRRVWESIIASKLGKHRKKIWARNTNFRSIPSREANAFLEINHLQGRTPGTKWCFGLFLGAELAGIVIFAGHEKRLLNLTRLAFPLGTTVVGGAQKLFHNSLLFLPKKDIVSFSSNRYSNGAIYPLLGFQKDRDMPPSYEWYFQGKVQNKRRFRHSRLAKALGPGYDPEKTEMENMFAAGRAVSMMPGISGGFIGANPPSESNRRGHMPGSPLLKQAKLRGDEIVHYAYEFAHQYDREYGSPGYGHSFLPQHELRRILQDKAANSIPNCNDDDAFRVAIATEKILETMGITVKVAVAQESTEMNKEVSALDPQRDIGERGTGEQSPANAMADEGFEEKDKNYWHPFGLGMGTESESTRYASAMTLTFETRDPQEWGEGSPWADEIFKMFLNKTPIGSIEYLILESASEKTVQIVGSYMKEKYRGRGLGKRLYQAFFRDMKEKGFEYVVSDETISEDAENVWKSLVRSGLAEPEGDQYVAKVAAVVEASREKEQPESEKYTQAEVGYESPSRHEGETCSRCQWFLAPDACTSVKGPIKPEDWCEKFDPKKRFTAALLKSAAIRGDEAVDFYEPTKVLAPRYDQRRHIDENCG